MLEMKAMLSCHKVSLNMGREGELLGFQPRLSILEKQRHYDLEQKSLNSHEIKQFELKSWKLFILTVTFLLHSSLLFVCICNFQIHLL